MKKTIRGFGYAFAGIKKAFLSESNMKIHVTMATAVVIAAFYFEINSIEWMFCLTSIAAVISFEMINTAIEDIVDLISPQKNKMAGRIKDVAAGAVLIISIFAAIIGLIIFVPKGIELFI